MQKSTISFLVIIFILTGVIGFAQNETSNWFFGTSSIRFSNGSPTLITGSKMNQLEGTSSISDASGNLLLYTDGVTVWNGQHDTVLNGTGLTGGSSATQSAIIIPAPGNKSIYYIFTAPELNTDSIAVRGLRYSMVDIHANNGKGEVVKKNVLLLLSTSEKLAAIRNCNDKDIWIVSTELNTNKFYVYALTKNGICQCPVISEVASTRDQSQGYLKFSPDGTKLVNATAYRRTELYNFDRKTGKVTFLDSIPAMTSYNGIKVSSCYYGASFSPDNTKLYVSSGWWGALDTNCAKVVQYDLNAPNLIASQTILYDNAIILNQCKSDGVGALQLAQDGKIYITNWGYHYLHVIDSPNNAGIACNFIEKGFYLDTVGLLGLPNFVESYFDTSGNTPSCDTIKLKADFSFSGSCSYQDIQFTNHSTVNIGNFCEYSWNFGDPTSSNNVSVKENPIHTYPPGSYIVTLIVKSAINCITDTIKKQITIFGGSITLLGKDTTLCGSDILILNATNKDTTAIYLWQDNSKLPTFTVTKSGTYWIIVSLNNCKYSDTIRINYTQQPKIDLGRDTILCSGDQLVLNATTLNASYLWQNGNATSTFKVIQQGTYWVKIMVGACSTTDTIHVNYNPAVMINLGKDTTLCGVESLIVNASASITGAMYLWSDGSSAPFLKVTKMGTYWVKINFLQCSNSDTIHVNYNPIPNMNLGEDTTIICLGGMLFLNPIVPNAAYLWQDKTTNPFYNVTQEGMYFVKVTLNGCSISDSMYVRKEKCEVVLYIPNSFTPDDDALNDVFKALGVGIESMHTTIYNRWGNKIYETDELFINWDGTFNGKDVPNDVYFWVIDYQDINKKKSSKKGHVTLVR